MMLAVVLAPQAARAQVINDGVSNTLLLTEREGSYLGQGGSRATAEPGETSVGGLPASDTVWYRYVAPANGRYVVDFDDQQGLRAELRYPGNPATTIPLQTVADGTSNTVAQDRERLSVNLDRGQQVYLVVDASQPFSFSWRFSEVVNNHWQDAETLTGDSGTVVRSNRRARQTLRQRVLGVGHPAVWFEWTAPSTGDYYLDLVGSRQWDASSYDDFGLYVYSSVNGEPVNLVGSGYGSSLDNSTRVLLPATQGHSYYIACTSGPVAPDSQLWLSWYPAGSPGVLAWAQEEHRISEADGSVSCRFFKLRGNADGSVRFISETLDNGLSPATAGVDYSIPGDAVLLPPGVRSGVTVMPILPDAGGEPVEAFRVGFTDATGGLGIADGTSNTVLIGEQVDRAECTLTWREVRVREGQTAYVEIRRQSASDRQVAVGWRVNSGTCQAVVDMPALSGTAYLSPGQLSTSIAIPVYPDQAFEGPEYFNVNLTDNPQLGSITDGSSLTVITVEDDDFFVPQPGGYCGLLDTQGWGALVKCTVNGLGGASGTVDYMGATYRFSGVFDASGQLVAHFARNGRPSIGLRLQFAEGWSRCRASLRDPEGDWADGYVRRLPYDGKKTLAPQVGSYTIFCQGMGGGSVQVPAVMTSVVTGDGSVRFVGRTADEQTMTFSSRIGQSDQEGSVDGECAFMLPLYNKLGNFYGTCDFGLGPQHAGGQTQLGWLKPWRPRDALYPALPFQTIACWALRYTPPAAGQRVTSEFTQTLGDGSVRFINPGGVLDGTSNTLLISEANKVTITEPNNPLKCSITMDPKTGWFSGKLTPPGSTKQIGFNGVFHQGAYGYGRGLIPLGSRAGGVEILPDF